MRMSRNGQMERSSSIGPDQLRKMVERWTTFSKLFRLDQTDPFSFRPKFPEILVEWIAPMGAYHSTENFEIFETGTNGTEIPENTVIVEFPKSEPLNRKFRKFWDESQMEQKFPGEHFRKFGYTSRDCPLFRSLCKFPIFYSAPASSFGRDHSELDISCKDDAHSIKERL